ncbi:MAG: ABC transporter ATP-binding protein [Bacteroidetes bacterium]|nr:ABC transporter ATP-binding protein [Bacteroidota bacterium]MBS1642388.1 ABC transporter ATP-binding protein [Bacteroidota bacterium]MBS1671611.1 ABC transporter ATP-binding protein [Bacteroidota bacterium]
MSNALLSINNLRVSFSNGNEKNTALHNITIEVKKGETVAVVGESGSGKSITSLAVLQLLPSPPANFESGEIILNNDNESIDLLHANNKIIRTIRGKKIAMIFQEPMSSLNPVITCGKQVMEAITTHQTISAQAAKIKTIELFKQVQLPNPELIFNRYPHEISGGQKQRVMIAMAMSCEPELLICDEPTTALDVTVQKNILELINNLKQQNNMSVIFISHDLSVVAEIADRIIVMYKGKIVEENITKEIFINPQHAYTQALLQCRPSKHLKGERLPVVSDFLGEKNTENKLPIVNYKKSEIGNEPILSVKNLKVYFPAKKNFLGKTQSFIKAVDDVSFEVKEGETIGLVGESGCGKSTLGRTILRLIDATEGSIIYKKNDLIKADNVTLKALRKDMQLIFQDPYSSLNPRMKIGEAIEEPLLVHNIFSSAKTRKEKVIEWLEKVNLSANFYNRYPHEFSGGQRQRIVIARALIMQPSFVICDESVAALDVSMQAQILNLLNDLKNEIGFTNIFISHDLSVVRYISDRIIVMHKGKIEEEGNAETVYNNPQKAYTQKLIESIPQIKF